MWKQFNPDGTLTYGNFGNSNSNYQCMDESYWWNPYLIGMFTLVYNIIQTVRLGSKIEDELEDGS
jgi:cytochrome c oxidase cbb3-type subunit I/II